MENYHIYFISFYVLQKKYTNAKVSKYIFHMYLYKRYTALYTNDAGIYEF